MMRYSMVLPFIMMNVGFFYFEKTVIFGPMPFVIIPLIITHLFVLVWFPYEEQSPKHPL